MERLRSGPQPVVAIARELAVGRPAVSQHLKILKTAGLVEDEAVGTRRLYRVNPAGLAELELYARSFWTQALTRFAEAARHVEDARQAEDPLARTRRRPRS